MGVLVEVRLAQGSRRVSTHLNLARMRQCPEEAFKAIRLAAGQVLPVKALRKITYIDDDGDSCTLSSHSLADALEFCQQDDDTIVLMLNVEAMPEVLQKPMQAQACVP